MRRVVRWMLAKLTKMPLCGLGTQIAGGRAVLGHADGGLEHQVELADGGKIVLAADGADDVLVLCDESIHLVKAHGIHVHLGVLLADQLVGAVAGLAGAAVQQGVREAGHMAGGHPGLGVHDDGCIQTHVVGALLHELLQPCLFDVVLELHAQGAVVPAVGQTAVDLGTGEHITTVLAEIDDHVKGLFSLCSIVVHPFPSAAGLPCRMCVCRRLSHRRASLESTVSLLYHVLRGFYKNWRSTPPSSIYVTYTMELCSEHPPTPATAARGPLP